MFGKSLIKDKKYLILAIRKNNILHCGVYTKSHDNFEIITSIETGEIFDSIKSFVISVIGLYTKNEYKECLYYNETKNRWRSIKYIMYSTHI